MAPENVTEGYLTDPTLHEVIIDFYELLEAKAKSMSIVELILSILEVAEGNFYMRESTDYYRVKLTFPFFACDWVHAPLPGQGDHPAPPLLVR